MRALLVIAHGSPRPEANEDIARVVDMIRERQLFDLVEIGYLDVNQPDIPASLDLCARAGATSIIAVPYFLHSGKHVMHDIPSLLAEWSGAHQGIDVQLGDFIGNDPMIDDVLAARAVAGG